MPTSPRILTLSPADAARLPLYLDEWLARGLATGPTDRAAIEDAMRLVYQGVGREPPPVIIWMQSPLGGALAATVLHQTTALGAQLWTQLGAQFGDQLGDQLRNQLRTQLGDQLRNQLWNQFGDQFGAQLWAQLGTQLRAPLWDQLRAQLWTQLGTQLRDQFGDQLRAQLWTQLWTQLWAQPWTQLRDQLRAQLGNQLWGQLRASALWGQHDIPWVAWFDFARQIGVALTESQETWLRGMCGMADGGWWWPFEGAAILTERPTALHRDAQGRLHNESGMAIAYADGWGVHAIHGTRVPVEIVEQPETLTPQTIMAYTNAEVRRVAIERYGWDRFVPAAGLVLVDEQPDPANPPYTLALYEAPPDLLGYAARVVLCTNASPERDGTRRRFGLTVPADMTDAIDAIAWTFRLDGPAYRQMERAS